MIGQVRCDSPAGCRRGMPSSCVSERENESLLRVVDVGVLNANGNARRVHRFSRQNYVNTRLRDIRAMNKAEQY